MALKKSFLLRKFCSIPILLFLLLKPSGCWLFFFLMLGFVLIFYYFFKLFHRLFSLWSAVKGHLLFWVSPEPSTFLCSLVDLESQKHMLLSPVGVSKDRACGVGPLGCKGSSDVPSGVSAIPKDSFSQRKVCTQMQSLVFSLLLRLCWEILPSPLSPYMRPFALSPLWVHRFVHIVVILAFMFCDPTVTVMNTMLKAMNCLKASKTNIMLIQSTNLLASYIYKLDGGRELSLQSATWELKPL